MLFHNSRSPNEYEVAAMQYVKVYFLDVTNIISFNTVQHEKAATPVGIQSVDAINVRPERMY